MVESIQEFVKNKSIVFVGNSVEIMQHKLAEKIASYDIVVRFGRAINATPRHEESISDRCDIWVTGQFRAPIYNELKKEFTTGKWKDTKILVNRSRGNLNLKDWKLEEHLPKDMPQNHPNTIIYAVPVGSDMAKDILKSKNLRPSAGFITILWFINKVKTYKSLDLIGFDFFAKSVKERRTDKKGNKSSADPHSWHLPVYILPVSAHDMQFEQQYISFLERKGLLNWHVLSNLKEEGVNYTGWMKGIKRVKSAPRKSKISKI